MHYEVERRQLADEDDGTGVLQITGQSWRTVMVFRGDMITTPLTFDSLEEARSYVGRKPPGSVRIVRVTDHGEREVVEAEPHE
jgi:hypothetical protein